MEAGLRDEGAVDITVAMSQSSRANHHLIVRRGGYERFARVNQRRLSSTAPNAVTRMMAATTGAHLVQQITLSKADGIKREHEQDEFAGVTYPLRAD